MIVFFHLVNGADVRVVQGRSDAGLALKPLQGPLVMRQTPGQEFQSHAASQSEIFRFVHDAHSATAQLSQDSIV